jgi:hypothetical protein
MYEVSKTVIIDLSHGFHCIVGERRQVGSGRVFFYLLGAFGAGDGAADGVVHEDPAEGELREGPAGWAGGF